MRPATLASAAVVMMLVLLGGADAFAATSPFVPGGTATTCKPSGNPFSITNAYWGTQGSILSVAAGDSDVPLTVSLLYAGGCTLTAASFGLTLSQPFSLTSGGSYSTDYEANLASGTITNEVYYLNLNSTAAVGTYNLPLSIGYEVTTSKNAVVSYSESTKATISLRGSVELSFSAGTSSLFAGETNNLTVTITNGGTGNATAIDPGVTASSQVGILSQLSGLSLLSSGASVAESLRVFVPASLAGSVAGLTFGASYYDAYSIERLVTQGISLSVIAPTAPPLTLVQTNSSFVTGTQTKVAFTLTNDGTQPISSVVFTLAVSSPVLVTGNSPSIPVAVIGPGKSSTYVAQVGSGSNAPAGFYSGTVSVGFTDQNGIQRTESFAVGFTLSSAALVPLSLSQSNNSLVVGKESNVSYSLTNEGSSAVSSLVFTLSASSPITVLGNSPSSPAAVLDPGQTSTYVVSVGTSPSANEGIYGGTLDVSYVDQNGVQHSQDFSVGFTLTGSVVLVLQGVEVSQVTGSVTVSGSLLNEGTSPAYYSQVTGSIRGDQATGETPDYVGEVDTNTPTPFTVTIPYSANTAQNSAQISLTISYKNSFGNVSNYTSITVAGLESAEQLFLSTATTASSSSGPSTDLVTIVSYGVLAVIVASVIAAALVIRRRRVTTRPPREDKVI